MREFDFMLTLIAVCGGLLGLCWAICTLLSDLSRARRDKADCAMWRQRRVEFRKAVGMPSLDEND